MEIIEAIKNLSNLYNWWENVFANNFKRLQNDLRDYFEKIDHEIFISNWRKEKGYISKEIEKRRILTIAGTVSFKRRRYKYFDRKLQKWRYVHLADQKIGIEKYERINSHVKLKILELIANGVRYDDIIAILKINISRMSVSNVINSFNLKDFEDLTNYDVKKVFVKNCLYIQLDDTFVALRDKEKKKQMYRIRFVTFHTGYDTTKSTKNRKVIANKRIFFKLVKSNHKINTADFMGEVYGIANKFYQNIKNAKIIISGDGASWIQESSKYWPGSFYIFDKFHAFRKLKHALKIDKSHKTDIILKIIKSYFESGNYEELQDILKSFLNNSDYQHKNKIIKETISYFKNNKVGIVNQNNEFNIGCHIESDISHNIKWLLGYGSKAFNYKTFQNMLILKMSQTNKVDPLSLIKKVVIEEKKEWKNYYWQNSWTNKKKMEEYHQQGEIVLNKRAKMFFP